MPHIYLENNIVESLVYPLKSGDFEFAFEAFDIRNNGKNNRSIIFVKSPNGEFLLTKQVKDSKILVKYNDSIKVQSIGVVKSALREFGAICEREFGAKILTHNINGTKMSKNIESAYFMELGDFEANFLESLRESMQKSTQRESTQKRESPCNPMESSVENKVVIEIGFGSGRHLLDMAKSRPNAIFIGLEIYRPAIEQVLNQIKILHLENLYLSNADCRVIFDILPTNCIDEIYLHFPVPWDKNPSRRVMSVEFLEQCSRILKDCGFLELRTDSKEYYDYALACAKNEPNFTLECFKNAREKIISKYETRWIKQNKDIFSIKFHNTKKCKTKRENVRENASEIDLKNLAIDKILESKSAIKAHKDGHFYHIKNIFRFDRGFVLFVIFGSYSVPNAINLLINSSGEVEILGKILPTFSNKKAILLLKNDFGI